MQPRDELFQLRLRAGAPQGHRAYVVVEIYVVIVNPHRFGQFERHLRQLAGQHRSEVHALANHSLDCLVVVALVVLRQFEKHKAADMHRRFRSF